ncbi:MAG: T9SS type A sorting domain-containing protein [Flavobacteriales bacterium]|nr:T9SS type A sorting domain-containing protein [Flavobacteriales bacterium]
MKATRLSLLAGLTLLGNLAFGQYYYLTDSGNTPGGLNQDPAYPAGGGQVAGWNSILGPSVGTPTWSADQTIPFTFEFNGTPVTSYKVSSTGVLTFSTGATAVPGSTPSALPSASIPDNSVCVWGLEATGSNDNVSTKTFGSAGSQQEWIHFSSCTNGSISWSYWSIVLEEGTNDIYIVDQRNTSGTGALSVGIQIDGTTAISDPASPSVDATAGTDFTSADDFYYRFIYGSQPQNEVELMSFDILSYIGTGGIDIMGTVKNLGSDPITALSVTWDDGSGPNQDNITGLNIQPNQTYQFTSPTQLNSVAGSSYTIDLNATITGDADLTNNDIQVSTVALTQIPTKYVVGEEKTGTWCGWCPRGAVGLANMESVSEFIGIAIHNGDPMTIAAYDSGINTYIPGGYPGGGVDRVLEGNPSASNFLYMHNERVGATVPCDVKNLSAVYDPAAGNITVSGESEWYGSVSGNYRFSCVIVEDDVMGTGSDWGQENYYSGEPAGTMQFPSGVNGGFDFSTAGSSVNPADFGGYDHVARYLSDDDILGDAGSLPSGSVPLGVHSHTFDPIPANVVNDLNKAHAVVMIVNADNGEILNAYKTAITGGNIGINEIENAIEMKLYPNPANDIVHVSFTLENASDVEITLTDAMGNTVMNSSASMNVGSQYATFDASALANGVYFVNIVVDGNVVTERLSVTH